MKKISIIIPVYNTSRYLRKCLDSIVCQNIDYNLYEVIVVNDGSPDEAQDIIDEYINKYPHLLAIKQQNQGLSVARNNGLKAATGLYVWFVDSDDWLFDGSLSLLLKNLESSYDLYASILEYSYNESSRNFLEIKIKENILVNSATYILKYPLGAIQRFIIRREILLSHNIWFMPGILHEDMEYSPRLLSVVSNVYMLQTPLYHYYQREGSIISTWREQNTKCLVNTAVNGLNSCKHCHNQDLLNSALKSYYTDLILKAYPKKFSKVCTMDKNIIEVLRNNARSLVFNKYIGFRKNIKWLIVFLFPKLLR